MASIVALKQNRRGFGIGLLVVIFELISVWGAVALAQPSPDDYLIEYGGPVMQRHTCRECPGYVAQMLEVLPRKLRDLKDKSEIIVNDCHATLVGFDLVLTASHCMRKWDGPSKWSTLADGDCAKVYKFYFPTTDHYPYEEARCREILTPVAFNSGHLQLEPDDVLVRLDHAVNRESAPIEHAAILDQEKVEIWGYDGEIGAYAHRTCHRITGSLLTPLDLTGEGAYTTLTCDGPVTTGCSGGGVFVDGKLRGVISCGVAGTTYGISQFGLNEVVISQSYCAVTGATPAPSSCFVEADRQQGALHDLYLSAIEKTDPWVQQTRQLLEQKFPYAKFEYTHGPQTLPPFTYTPGYMVKCVYAGRLPENDRVLVGALFDLATFWPRYVIFNPDTTVHGVSLRSEGGEEFNIGFRFNWADRSEVGTSTGVPYCP